MRHRTKKKGSSQKSGGQKNPRKERFQLGCIWPSGPSNYPADAFGLVQFQPTPKQESPMLRKNKKQGDSTYKFVYLKIKIYFFRLQ
jgi:hypothetical protein